MVRRSLRPIASLRKERQTTETGLESPLSLQALENGQWGIQRQWHGLLEVLAEPRLWIILLMYWQNPAKFY